MTRQRWENQTNSRPLNAHLYVDPWNVPLTDSDPSPQNIPSRFTSKRKHPRSLLRRITIIRGAQMISNVNKDILAVSFPSGQLTYCGMLV